MFKGNAGEALALYQQAFVDLELVSMQRYSADGPGAEGTIKRATASILGQHFTVIDSAVDHDFDFSPSVSFFVECDSDEMLSHCFNALSSGGEVLMSLGDYGFSRQFGWVADPFGVSWQLNLK